MEKFDEKITMWRDENNKRICTYENETLKVIAKNCIEFLTTRDTIYVDDVVILLEKALDGVADKKDLTPLERDSIKRIRRMINGL